MTDLNISPIMAMVPDTRAELVTRVDSGRLDNHLRERVTEGRALIGAGPQEPSHVLARKATATFASYQRQHQVGETRTSRGAAATLYEIPMGLNSIGSPQVGRVGVTIGPGPNDSTSEERMRRALLNADLASIGSSEAREVERLEKALDEIVRYDQDPVTGEPVPVQRVHGRQRDTMLRELHLAKRSLQLASITVATAHALQLEAKREEEVRMASIAGQAEVLAEQLDQEDEIHQLAKQLAAKRKAARASKGGTGNPTY